MVLGLIEVLNQSWLCNVPEQLPFRIPEWRALPAPIKDIFHHFENSMNWQFLAAKNMCIESEIIHGEGRRYFFRIVTVSERQEELHPL
jgi:hypothetical protein